MKLSTLASLISGRTSAAEYSAGIAEELAEHVRHLRRGASAPVKVTEDVDLLLDSAGLAVLCRYFANGNLTAEELAYTADALQLAERVDVSDAQVADDLDSCTDPEVNGP